jgi:Cu+-exporting ATPase
MHSSHPIAKSILNDLEDTAKLLELNDIKEIKGHGIQAIYKGDLYQLGSAKFVDQKEGKPQFFLTKNRQLLAQIYCSDQQREGLKETILELQNEGLSISMLSGDKNDNCQKLAQNVGINNVFSEQLPQQKLEQIEQLNKQGFTAMVGDGINDAPALAKAHVGISLGGSTEVAIDSAQIVLLNKGNLHQLVQAFKISKHTLLTIKQNLFWAFSYNIVAIPIAAMGFLNPMWGALFMAFSDVIVIGNSLRLKNKSIF